METETRCLRCGDVIVKEGVNYICVGCNLRLDRHGRRHPTQRTKAQQAKQTIERKALSAITDGFGGVESTTCKSLTFGESRRLAESQPAAQPAKRCESCRRNLVLRMGKVICLECGEIRPS